MDGEIKEVDGKLFCLKYNHNEPIIMFVMDDQVPLLDKFLCVKCLKINKDVAKIVGIDQAIDIIKQKFSAKNIREERIKKHSLFNLQNFVQKMKNLQGKVLQLIDDTLRLAYLWIKEIEEKIGKDDLMSQIKITEKSKTFPNYDDEDETLQCNQSYFEKIDIKIKRLLDMDDWKHCQDALKHIQNINKQQELQPLIKQFQKPQLIIQVKLINTVKQNEWSVAIAFNQLGSLMVAGCKEDIKVWKFDKGIIQEVNRLKGHKNTIYCIVFSKKINWFASGSDDRTIRCWKELIDGNWECYKPEEEQHIKSVSCLLLTSNEDQLISCSFDHTIKVWNVNCQKNLIVFQYTLENKHKERVNCICLNDSETTLVSCSYDKLIILWTKGFNAQWIYTNNIINEDYGMRVGFISDDFIAWQQYTQGTIIIFQIIEGVLIKRPDLNIQLDKAYGDHQGFPIIENRMKQFFVWSHGQFVYILQNYSNGKLSIVGKPIDCFNTCNYGAMTEDGLHLVIWTNEAKEFKIFNIIYL